MKKLWHKQSKPSEKSKLSKQQSSVTRTQSFPKKLDEPPKVETEVKKNNTLPPNSSRDLESAMDYIERYHTKFDGSVLTQPISESISNQVELLISTSKRMETPNFFFFDKCPTAVVYFLKNYLETLDAPLIDEEQVTSAFTIIAEIDPLERVNGFQQLLSTNKNKNLVRHLLLFLNGIVKRSSSPKVTLDCMIKLFSGCIFRVHNPVKKQTRKQKAATSFVIHRAEVIFPEKEGDSGMTKEEATGIHSVQFASRILGTDGMLYLLEQELQRIEDDLEQLDYDELKESFNSIESDLESLENQSKQLTEKQSEFEKTFSNRLHEVQAIVDQCEPVYNNLDFQGAISEDDVSEGDH